LDRCALFVDANYALAEGALAVHGTRNRDSVSWDYTGLLKLFGGLSRDRTGLPLLRCYWYDTATEPSRGTEHEALADIPGVKLRISKARPSRKEGVEAEIRKDLTVLARNHAVSDVIIVSAEEDLGPVISEVQDLGVRAILLHVSVDGDLSVSRALRQECDEIIEVAAGHLRPYVDLIAGAEPQVAAPGYRELSAAGAHPSSPQPGNGAPAQQFFTPPLAAEYESLRQPQDGLVGRDQREALRRPEPARYETAARTMAEPGPDKIHGRPEVSAHQYSQLDPSRGQVQANIPEAPAALAQNGYAPDLAQVQNDRAQNGGGPASMTNAGPAQPAGLSQASAARGGQSMNGLDPRNIPGGSLQADGHAAPAARAMQQPGGAGHPVAHAGGLPVTGASQQPSDQVAARRHANGQHASMPQDSGHLPNGSLSANGLGQGIQANGMPPGGMSSNGLQHRGGAHHASDLPPAQALQPSQPDQSYGTPGHGQQPMSRHSAGPSQNGSSVLDSQRPVLPQRQLPAGDMPYASDRGSQYGGQPQHFGGSAGAYPPARYGSQQPSAMLPAPQVAMPVADAVQSAHAEGFGFGEAVARDAPALWLEAVLARKPRMPSDLEARLLQGSALPIDSLLHDEVRHALRRGFWDALERSRH